MAGEFNGKPGQRRLVRTGKVADHQSARLDPPRGAGRAGRCAGFEVGVQQRVDLGLPAGALGLAGGVSSRVCGSRSGLRLL